MQVIHTADAPSHTGPVPQAVEAGGWIYVSALFGAYPATHEVPADARDEASSCSPTWPRSSSLRAPV